jgi:hypothetical protein
MTRENEMLRQKLTDEARQWIEVEYEARMDAASDEIETQANLGGNLFHDEIIHKHVRDATAYAGQEIRRELEMESEKWIEEEMKRRGERIEKTELKYRDENLDARFCGMDDH